MLSRREPLRIVLALREGAEPAPSLWWARALADGFGADLHEFGLAHDDPCGTVAAYAVQIDAGLIVVPTFERSMGRAVTSLAAVTRMPVLVACAGSTETPIVAATDLRSTAYPVLRLASSFERCLNVPVVTVHNVQPPAIVVDTGMCGPSVMILPPDPGRAARLDRLTRASARLFADAQAVLRDEASVVHAILDEARRRDAALVVVGTSSRNWWERLLTGSVAERVVNRADRSVLVTPLDEPWS